MSAVRTMTIPVARPVLGEPEADAARRAILSGWVTQGPEVAAFEQEFIYTGIEERQATPIVSAPGGGRAASARA